MAKILWGTNWFSCRTVLLKPSTSFRTVFYRCELRQQEKVWEFVPTGYFRLFSFSAGQQTHAIRRSKNPTNRPIMNLPGNVDAPIADAPKREKVSAAQIRGGCFSAAPVQGKSTISNFTCNEVRSPPTHERQRLRRIPTSPLSYLLQLHVFG